MLADQHLEQVADFMLLGEWVASRTTSIESLADLPMLGEDMPVVLGDRLAPSM